MLPRLPQPRKSADIDPYRGAQHDVAIRVTGMLWIGGAVTAGALSAFFHPTAQIGTAGWVLLLAALVVIVAVGSLGVTLRVRPSSNLIYVSAYLSVALIAISQWLAGGGSAPFIQILLLPAAGVACNYSAARCVPFALAAAAAAFSPLLYSTVEVPAAATEFALLLFAMVTVAGVMTSVRMHRAQLRDAGEHAAVLARRDPLTGLPNRRSFDEVLDRAIDVARLQRRPLSLMLCDIDSFKEINDRFGHLAGDECLQSVAAALREALRRPDAAFRWAGDEFAVILQDADELSAGGAAARLRDVVAEHCIRPDGNPITLGVGVVELRSGMSTAELIERADQAMLESKAARRSSRVSAGGSAAA